MSEDRIFYSVIGEVFQWYALMLLVYGIYITYKFKRCPDWDCKVVRALDVSSMLFGANILLCIYIGLIHLWVERVRSLEKQLDPNTYGWLILEAGMLMFMTFVFNIARKHVLHLEKYKSLCPGGE